MNKNDLISAVSIEFGLSNEHSVNAINILFDTVSKTLRKDKNLKINKFGKFKLIYNHDTVEKSVSVKFIPSRKLSQRVNGKFGNLKKITIKEDLIQAETNGADASAENIREVDKDKYKEAGEKIISAESKESLPVQRKLISEEVIKLHKEITREEDKNTSDTNLWG